MRTSLGRVRTSSRLVLLLALAAVVAVSARAQPPRVAITPDDAALLLPLDDFSPQFLGMYRKAMRIENEIRGHTEQYGVDYDLARAVLIQESGGNPGLTSVAGADGYFQVMPATFRSLRVDTNIEAGIKYLDEMIRQFGREDYAVAAYNGGPGRARSGRPPLETLQYLLSVGAYRNLLKLHESLRPAARHRHRARGHTGGRRLVVPVAAHRPLPCWSCGCTIRFWPRGCCGPASSSRIRRSRGPAC